MFISNETTFSQLLLWMLFTMTVMGQPSHTYQYHQTPIVNKEETLGIDVELPIRRAEASFKKE